MKREFNLFLKSCLAISVSIFAVKIVFAFAYTDNSITSNINGNNQGVVNNSGSVFINNGTIDSNNGNQQNLYCLVSTISPLTQPGLTNFQQNQLNCDAVENDQFIINSTQMVYGLKWVNVTFLTGMCANQNGWIADTIIKRC